MYNRGAWSRVRFLVLVERPRLPTGCDGHDEHSAPMDSGLSHEEKGASENLGFRRGRTSATKAMRLTHTSPGKRVLKRN